MGPFNDFFVAIKKGKLTEVLLFLNQDVTFVNKTDAIGNTPLRFAAIYSQDKVAKLLIERGADVNAIQRGGVTSLYMAAENGLWEAVKLLISKGVDVDKGRIDGVTPLYTAVENGHLRVVKMLLDAKADVDQATTDLQTPLFIAVCLNKAPIIEALVSAGASVQDVKTDRKVRSTLSMVEGPRMCFMNLLSACDIEKDESYRRSHFELLDAHGKRVILSRFMNLESSKVEAETLFLSLSAEPKIDVIRDLNSSFDIDMRSSLLDWFNLSMVRKEFRWCFFSESGDSKEVEPDTALMTHERGGKAPRSLRELQDKRGNSLSKLPHDLLLKIIDFIFYPGNPAQANMSILLKRFVVLSNQSKVSSPVATYAEDSKEAAISLSRG